LFPLGFHASTCGWPLRGNRLLAALVVTNVGVRRALRALGAASAWASVLLSSAAVRAGDAQPVPARAELATEAKAEAKAEPDAEAAKPTKPASAASAAPENAGETAYQRALAAYAAGDVKGAFEAMRESYRLSQRPELLYNLAMLERELEECQASLEDYRRYLQRVPNGRYRDAAEQASHELERECPAADPVPAAVPVQPGPTVDRAAAEKTPQPPLLQQGKTSYWTTPHVLAWSAIGVGAVAGGAALYFELAAKTARNDFATNVGRAEASQATLDLGLEDRQHRDETAAAVLGLTGGVLVTSGVLFLILGPDAAHEGVGNAFIYFPPSGLGACYSHGF
jgi:hypothetical protein